MKSTRRFFCGALALATGLAFLPARAGAQDLTPVTLRMDVFFYGAHVPMLLGIVDGIYKKHGLDVTAQTGRGSATTIQTVANGTDHFGFADGGVLVKFAAQGLKAKLIVGILQTSPSIIFSMPDKNIVKPADLNGRTGGLRNDAARTSGVPYADHRSKRMYDTAAVGSSSRSSRSSPPPRPPSPAPRRRATCVSTGRALRDSHRRRSAMACASQPSHGEHDACVRIAYRSPRYRCRSARCHALAEPVASSRRSHSTRT